MAMSDKIAEPHRALSKKAEKKRPVVKNPKNYLNIRKGRGFSRKEIKSASIPLDDAQKLPITIDLRRNSVHDENVKILSALYRDFVSLRSEKGVELEISKKEAYKEFKQLRGIKSGEAKLIIEAGIKSLKTLMEEEPLSLADDTKIKVEKIEHWINQAKDLIKRKGIEDSIEELLKLKGMNKTYAKKLTKFGILSIEDLSKENADILSKDLKISEKIISVWIEDAMRLAGRPVPKKKKPAKKPEEGKITPPKVPKEEKKAPPSLKDLEGISKGDLKSLKDLGVTKLEQLLKEDIDEISSITGIDKLDLERWTRNARELLGLPEEIEKPKEKEFLPQKETPPTEDPLKVLLKLEGIGKKTAEKLVNAGIMSLTDIIEGDPKELSKKAKVSEKTLKKIIESAGKTD